MSKHLRTQVTLRSNHTVCEALHLATAVGRNPLECLTSKQNGRYIARRIAIVRDFIALLYAYAASPDANPKSPAFYVAGSFQAQLDYALRELRGNRA